MATARRAASASGSSSPWATGQFWPRSPLRSGTLKLIPRCKLPARFYARSISTTASSAAESAEAAEAKKAANEKKDAEDRAKLEEFAAKGGVGMELPEAKAAVAAAQRLLAAQAKVSPERTFCLWH